MPKKDTRKDSTTDFFLNFITRQKEQNKEDKKVSAVEESDTISAKTKAATLLFKGINFVNQALDKILSSNLSIKILSFAMTIILVFILNGGSLNSVLTSPTSGEFLQNIEVKVEGLSTDYEVSGLQETVTVAVIGSSIDITTTKVTNNYEVYVDLTNLGEGEHTVECKYRNFPSSLNVSITPTTVTLKIAPKVTKTFSLGYRFVNEDKMEKTYSVEVIGMQHDDVEVRASQDVMDKIYSVQANIDLTGVEASFTQKAKIFAYDRSGQRLTVEIIPSAAQVECSVSSYSKEVLIVPVYKGVLEDGHAISKTTLSESKTTIYGSEDVLKNIKEVYVTIDVSGLNETRTLNNLVVLKQDGINKLSIEKVNAKVEIEKSTTKTILDIPISVINNTNNYKITFQEQGEIVNLQIVGAISLVDKLSVDDIKATIDVSGVEEGVTTANVKISLPSNVVYTLLTPEEITITVERQE